MSGYSLRPLLLNFSLPVAAAHGLHCPLAHTLDAAVSVTGCVSLPWEAACLPPASSVKLKAADAGSGHPYMLPSACYFLSL